MYAKTDGITYLKLTLHCLQSLRIRLALCKRYPQNMVQHAHLSSIVTLPIKWYSQ